MSPQLLPYLLHSDDEAPPRLGRRAGYGGSRNSNSNSRGNHSRGGSSSDSWVPNLPSTLARLLCCKSVVYTELES